MICFRDRSFCANEECKDFPTCDRALTDEVQQAAEEWWGSKDAPIAIYDFDCVKED